MGDMHYVLTFMHDLGLLPECGGKLLLINKRSAPYDNFQGNGELVTPESLYVPQVASPEDTNNIVKHNGLDV
ncbi:uncharacterized protein EAE98_007358 [Botrytis deweyae]|uniref:Uncharacterized protein n=1 Tax=Botrytis deweyae TaxID=2478750 RepID=A0ABQ7IHF7_9HELO|nr:uncharacterized protein EAE98_007358 [Botrytis deweyae]KAF7924307.1 hypothetical protein EAE98_007358 [Botrytis deweyae]KAF7937069.1 hypothetical protein EAE99_002418 [Botrytis elliptica]